MLALQKRQPADRKRIQMHRIGYLLGDSVSREAGAPERDCWG